MVSFLPPSAATPFTAATPLSALPGLPAAAVKMLAKEGHHTLGHLIMHLPSRHEDRRRMEFAGFSPSESPVCHHVRVTATRVLRFGGRGGSFEATVEAARDNPLHQQLTLRWFHMLFLQKSIAVGMEMMVYGKIKQVKDRLVMGHPEYEILAGEDDAGPDVHTGRIVPVYPLRGALKQKPLRAAIAGVLAHVTEAAFPDLLPAPKADGEFAGLSRAAALRTLHQPSAVEALERARRYLALEEFYLLQLRVVRRRLFFKHTLGHAQKPRGALLEAFLAALPFRLTGAQERSLHEIAGDMALSQPMNRLLHGDVGSGKTVVALAAMLLAVESGRQAALMAPTQILAEQHYRNALHWFEPLGLRVSLRTGDRKSDRGALELFGCRQDAPAGISPDAPHVFIGTHALLHEGNEPALSQLGLVVIDEQHKFGVAQRARLIARGEAPDVLVMTATPIPRTLTLTLYGDLDVSTIDQRPAERGRVVTAVREATKLAEVAKFVRSQIEEGRQAYIVYPLIEESEKLDAGAAVSGHAEWSRLLSPHTVGLLHGRMDSEEKEAVMQRFRTGACQALVSTTVIEVGVDVPNATVMVIHDAARFGLAQIHQLRGRIGRGSHTSWCVLFVPKGDAEAKERLRLLEETHDGFRIAEEDLRRRGPGNVLGHAQSGQAPLLFAEMLADTRLITLARRLAERTLEQDPELRLPEHALLRPLLGSSGSDQEVGRQ